MIRKLLFIINLLSIIGCKVVNTPTNEANGSIRTISSFKTQTLYYGPACSTNDYSNINGCINSSHPPLPSITRELLVPNANLEFASAPTSANSNIYGYPNYNASSPAPNTKTVTIPYARATLDGRIFFFSTFSSSPQTTFPYGYYLPSLMVFHPQNLGADLRGKNLNVISNPQYVHPIIIHNPHAGETAMDDGAYGNHTGFKTPNTWHIEICHESNAPNELKQVPRLCRTTKKGTEIIGDCYDVTLLVKLELPNKPHYEMRTTPVTIFVENPKLDTAKIYIFSRINNGNLLPPLEYVSNPKKWSDDLGVTNLKQMADLCYTTPKPILASDPKYYFCKFVFNQSWSKQGFNFHIPNNDMNFAPTQYRKNPGGAGNVGGGMPNFFEPSISGDGKLLFINGALGAGIFYSYNKEGSCRAEDWNQFNPISKMPIDPDIYQNYDLAKKDVYFRDSENKEIKPGQVIEGGYLWIDRKVRNLFFATLNADRDHYVNLFQKNNVFDKIAGKMVSVLGSWTQHKVVTLDNGVNFTDFANFGVGSNNNLNIYDGSSVKADGKASTMLFSPEHYLNYYESLMPNSPFDVVWMLASNTHRNSEIIFDEYMKSNSLILAHMNALMVRKDEWNGAFGVWLPKDGFWPKDEYKAIHNITDVLQSGFNPANALDQSRNYQYIENPQLQNSSTASNKYDPTALPIVDKLFLKGGARIEPINLGGVIGKGIYFDGVNDFITATLPSEYREKLSDHFVSIWLDSRTPLNNEIKRVFTYPDGSWIGLSREEIKVYSSLDQSNYSLSLAGHQVQLGKFFHFAVKIETKYFTPKNSKQEQEEVEKSSSSNPSQKIPPIILTKVPVRTMQFFINGNPVIRAITKLDNQYKEVTTSVIPYLLLPYIKKTKLVSYIKPQAPFSFRSSGARPYEFTIGGNPTDQLVNQSFQGWVDEFKLLEINNIHKIPLEEICNMALGSLMKIKRSDAMDEIRISKYFNLASNTKVFDWYDALKSRYGKICEQLILESYKGANDFADQKNKTICASTTHQFQTPLMKDRCLRAVELGINMKPLKAGYPRPDFANVGFCLTCHQDGALSKGLRIDALTISNMNREEDPRRQPSNPPKELTGCVPAHPLFEDYVGGSIHRCDKGNIIMDYIFDFNGKIQP